MLLGCKGKRQQEAAPSAESAVPSPTWPAGALDIDVPADLAALDEV